MLLQCNYFICLLHFCTLIFICFYCDNLKLSAQEKLKPPQADAPTSETGPAAATAAVEAKAEKPFLTGGSRAASKGSLLNPEGGSSMASTVLDMVSRKQPAPAAATAAAPSAADQRKTSSSSGLCATSPE